MTDTSTLFSLTIDEAISKVTNELNNAVGVFDKWLSKNATKMNNDDPDYKNMKQNIKLLRLHQKECIDMKSKESPLLQVHFFNEHFPQFSKTRLIEPVQDKIMTNYPLGLRRGNKVSKR